MRSRPLKIVLGSIVISAALFIGGLLAQAAYLPEGHAGYLPTLVERMIWNHDLLTGHVRLGIVPAGRVGVPAPTDVDARWLEPGWTTVPLPIGLLIGAAVTWLYLARELPRRTGPAAR